MDVKRIIDELKQQRLLENIPESQLRLIAVVGQFVDFEEGEVIVEPGDVCKSVWLVTEGLVEVQRHGDNLVIDHIPPGHVFGMASTLTKLPVPFEITAKKSTRALQLSCDDFLALLEKTPHLSINLLKAISAKMIHHGEFVAHETAI